MGLVFVDLAYEGVPSPEFKGISSCNAYDIRRGLDPNYNRSHEQAVDNRGIPRVHRCITRTSRILRFRRSGERHSVGRIGIGICTGIHRGLLVILMDLVMVLRVLVLFSSWKCLPTAMTIALEGDVSAGGLHIPRDSTSARQRSIAKKSSTNDLLQASRSSQKPAACR